MNHQPGIQKARNWTAIALCGGALTQCMLGFVGWSMNGRGFGWLDWVFYPSGIIYLGLALSARWHPRRAALLGAGLYAGFLSLQLLHGGAALQSGLVFKIPVVLFLLVAVSLARRRSATPPP